MAKLLRKRASELRVPYMYVAFLVSFAPQGESPWYRLTGTWKNWIGRGDGDKSLCTFWEFKPSGISPQLVTITTIPLLLDGEERGQGGYLVRDCVGFRAGLGTSWQTIASPSTNSTSIFELLAFHYTDQATWMFTLQNSSRILMSNKLKMQRAIPVCSLLSITVRVANLLRFVTQSGLHR